MSKEKKIEIVEMWDHLCRCYSPYTNWYHQEFLNPKNTIADNEHANEHAKNAQFSPI